MDKEIRSKIEILKQKMEEMEVGSVQQIMYAEILQELEDKLAQGQKTVKLHVAEEQTCDGCA